MNLQGGHLLVIHGVITQLPIYKGIYRGPITPFITGSGAHLVKAEAKDRWWRIESDRLHFLESSGDRTGEGEEGAMVDALMAFFGELLDLPPRMPAGCQWQIKGLIGYIAWDSCH